MITKDNKEKCKLLKISAVVTSAPTDLPKGTAKATAGKIQAIPHIAAAGGNSTPHDEFLQKLFILAEIPFVLTLQLDILKV